MSKKDQILQILNHFDVQYTEYSNLAVGPCPVHGGDNHSAFNVNIDEDSDFFGNWFCNTQKCHEGKHDFISLIMILGKCSRADAQKYIEIPQESQDTVLSFFKRRNKPKKTGPSRNQIRTKLKLVPEYYLNKGFSREILDEFDVGLCVRPQTQMENRIVFPVYDGEHMVGCTGRTINDNPIKWKVSKGFNKSNFLYGYWKSEDFIRKSKTIILVEGQGDVLKLHQAGIKNAVGIFGSALSEAQEFLIQRSGALNIVIYMDPDEAGEKARKDIVKKMSLLFNIYHVYTDKDAGDMSVEEIKEKVLPQLKGLI